MFIINNRWSSQKPPVGTQIDWGHPLSKGLVGCWVMNEGSGNKVKDLSYLGDGSTVNSPTWFSTSKGKSLRFLNASSQYVSMKDIDIYGDISISAWIYSLANITGVNQGVVGKSTSSGAFLMIRDSHPTANYSRCMDFYVGQDALGTTQLSYGKWYHVLGTHSDSKNFDTLYVNGNREVLQLGGVNNNNIADDAQPWKIGAYYSASLGNYFNGYITNVQIYKRILNDSDAKWLYTEPYCFLKPIVRRFYSISGQAPTETRLLQKIIIPSNSKIGIRDGVKMVWRY